MTRPGLFLAGLAVVLAAAAGLRYHNLDPGTFTHPDACLPNADIPHDLSVPAPRHTLIDTLRVVAAAETHPPGFSTAMYFWTKVFGTDRVVVRIPAVLFGIGTVWLVYVLGARTEGRVAGLLAATVLALHGTHVYWSQEPRQYSMGYFFALLSTVMLAEVVSGRLRGRWGAVLYVLATLAALSSLIYAWPVLVAQMLWVAVRVGGPAVPGVLRWQVVAFQAGTPLLALAAYQASELAHRSNHDLLTNVYQYVQFGFVFKPDVYIADPLRVPVAVGAAAFVLALFLLVRAVWAGPAPVPVVASTSGPPRVLFPLATAWAVVAILGFAAVVRVMSPGQERPVLAALAIPAIVAAAAAVLPWVWPALSRVAGLVDRAFARFPGAGSIAAWLAIVPAAAAALLSLASPIFFDKGVLTFVPYLVLVIARGVVSFPHPAARAAAAAAVLAGVCPVGLWLQTNRLHTIWDYRDITDHVAPDVRPTDLIFLEKNWSTTPLFLHMPADQYRYVQQNCPEAVAANPGARVWVVSLTDAPFETRSGVRTALADYHVTRTIPTRNGTVYLYEPGR